ncbi:flagellar protein FliT [Clostridium sp. YIM B02515]|uniref:Flagellar protein FliT n=1 Tax=Clostridium rhizosphaerae TaxID=2803861 RepID=A0ABS1TF52_9CLOT|nr:flagellar protein FliT [Clostridium rhizosphaerae]MBL4938004.1 flagellar protein FliT [Clostridium rhizosphaerae]
MKEYEVIFEQYKVMSIKILESLIKEDYDILSQLLGDRELLIEKMKELNLDTTDFKNQAVKYGIIENEAKIKLLMIQKMDDIKLKLHKLELGEKANKFYNKSFYDNNKVFSKKV